ncbi:MAG TPA: hypothetical protein VNK41_04470 [Vicinamibacterales bacterium]|nr:hypothetical protein [Vicinamibacterales bacterium]
MRRLTVIAPLLVALVIGVIVLSIAVPPAARRLESLPPDPREIAGAIHVHTAQSDGTGRVADIAAAAARAGLKFVILTDHGDGTRVPLRPAYVAGVLCVDGVEISTAGGHYIALGLERAAPYRLAGEPRDVVADVARLGGFGIVAHPDSVKEELRWSAWGEPFDALEWLNADSEWRDERSSAVAAAVLGYLFRGPETIASLFNRPRVLARLDAILQRRRVVALAGHDAHARIGLRGNWEPGAEDYSLSLPSYEAAFKSFAVRVQLDAPPTGDAERDAKLLLSALKAGHAYTAIDAQAGPPRLTFTASAPGIHASGGDDVVTTGPVTLEARVPDTPGVTLVLLRNGSVAATTQGPSLTYEHRPVESGIAVYRVEARLDSAKSAWRVPWIVSNAIRIAPEAPPRPVEPQLPPAEAVRRIPEDPKLNPWLVEHSKDSTGAIEPLPGRGVRLKYDLAGGSPRGQYAAAVLTFVPGTFEDWDRIRFRGQASNEMRLSVQVREPLKGRRWIRSVVLFPDAREITVRLDDMNVPEPELAGKPPRRELASILFVVDTTHTVPGTSGWVAIQDVRLEREAPVLRARP